MTRLQILVAALAVVDFALVASVVWLLYRNRELLTDDLHDLIGSQKPTKPPKPATDGGPGVKVLTDGGPGATPEPSPPPKSSQ